MTAFDRFLAGLVEHGSGLKRRGDEQVSAQCPGHEDGTASLTVTKSDFGVLVHCHAGCSVAGVLAPLGWTAKELFDTPRERRQGFAVVAEYLYTDETGRVLYVKQRGWPKTFRQYVDLPGGKRRWSLGDVPRVLYRLPAVATAVVAGERVFLVEGEKDADALAAAGVVATTWTEGAWQPGARPKWRPEYTRTLGGAEELVIVRDRDAAGRATAGFIAKQCAGGVRLVRVVEAREGKDAADHLAAGHGVEDFTDVTDSAAGDEIDDQGEKSQSAPSSLDATGGRSPSQASQLVALAREVYDLFVSADGRPYGVVRGGANIALPLRGRAGLRSQLAHRYTDAHGGSVPAAAALTDAVTVLEGIAASASPRTPHLRVAVHDAGIVVDLADPDGRCVVVGPEGWRREPRSPVLFRRSGALQPLPDPVREGDGLDRLRGLLNTDEDGFRLLVGWLVAAFMPELPHPILTFRGEQGTGKSTAAAMVIGLVDPSGAPKRTAPRDLRSWGTQAFNSWALCLDNVSTVPPWLSDALCRAVTGDGVIDRALYTDDDVVVLEFRRVLAMTTIDAGALAGDLAERLLTIELLTIPDHRRREEQDLAAAYRDAHPSILASLFDLLSRVLKTLPDVILTERPRMADFARVLAAVDQVTGWATLDTYRAATRDAAADVLDGDPFANALITLIDRAGPEGITMTAGELLYRIETPERPPKNWPKDATRAGGALKRLAPSLRNVGIEVDDTERSPDRKRQRLYRLTASPERRSEIASAASATDRNPALTSVDDADTGESPSTSAATEPTGAADTGALWSDASVRTGQGPDLRKQHRADTAVTVDAVSHLPSDAACAVCDEPLTAQRAAVGFTTCVEHRHAEGVAT